MTHSDSIVEITKGLVAVQKGLVPAKRNAENPFFKSRYADLATIWAVCRESLAANNLAVTQLLDVAETGEQDLVTMLMHTSGEWLSSRLRMTPAKANDPQAIGSALQYARRYALAAIVGIVTEGEDDDAEAAMAKQKPAPARRPTTQSKPAPRSNPPGLIERAITKWGFTDQAEVLRALGCENLEQVKKMYGTAEKAWGELVKAMDETAPQPAAVENDTSLPF